MNLGLTLIMSSAYVNQELAVEFGRLPPAFLPAGIRRLYEFQLDYLGTSQPVYMTLPERFTVSPQDQNRLAERGVSLVFVPEDLSLGESVLYALNLIGGPDRSLKILHGDTLVNNATLIDGDKLAVACGTEGYSWAEVTVAGNRMTNLQTVEAGTASERNALVACGLFSFSHSHALIRSIAGAKNDFIKGILLYSREHPIQVIETKSWLDFGHVQTFFRSRRMMNSARSFNTLLIDERIARKSSNDKVKIGAETNWFNSVPPAVRLYCARLIDAGETGDKAFYETEYEYLPTLSELFVFGALGRRGWALILDSCRDFLDTCAAVRNDEPADDALQNLVVVKTVARLRQYGDESGFDVHKPLFYQGLSVPSLMDIAEHVGDYINLTSNRRQCVMHGDFCLSNILYNFRMQRIHVIDPRGYVANGKPSIYGDVRYDLAKMAHSILGRYDQIIAGRYSMSEKTEDGFSIGFEEAPHQAWLESAFGDIVIDGIHAGGKEVQAISISLFLSMLPLHADNADRQQAFIANALRLYTNWKDTECDHYSDGREIPPLHRSRI